MKYLKVIFVVSALIAGLICGQARETKQRWVRSTVKSMSLREQIAQLFVIACHPRQGEEHVKKVVETVREEQLGGMIWGYCHPSEYVKILNTLQAQVHVPLLVTIDAEWGISMRLDSVIKFPQQLTLGAIEDNSLIYDFGVEVARQCGEIGVHVNFAPVVDVNNNPKNPVINMRSFGENKYKVTEKAYAYMKGMQDGGILTSLKHFPGHGDTDKDSHEELPVILHDKQRLNDIELYPFRELIKRGATGVMTGHLLVPALFPGNYPASQSREVCTDFLQKELKFKGLVITDALEMKGAFYNCDTSKVALRSLMAGNDILEIPVDVKKSIDEIEKAVKNGEVSKRVIRKKCEKILAAKYDLGLDKGFTPINYGGILDRLNTPEAKTLRMKLADASLTLLSNRNVLPLNAGRVQYIEIGQGSTFKKELSAYCAADTIAIDAAYTKERLDSLAASLGGGGTIVVGWHNVPRGRSYVNLGIDALMVDFLDHLAETNQVVLVFFGNPYAIADLKKPESFAAVVVAYDNSDEAQTASAKALFGRQAFSGKLPVTINDIYKEDFGLAMPGY